MDCTLWSQAPYNAAYAYDATYLYLLTVEDTIAQGGDPRNGSQLFANACHKTFKGMLCWLPTPLKGAIV